MMAIRYLVFCIFLILCSCAGRSIERETGPLPGKSVIEEANRALLQKDMDRIQSYIERRELEMEMTPTGLWYLIAESGSGDSIRNDDMVSFRYSCSLLDGTEIYTSVERGVKNVRIGRSTIESGLDEGLRMLRGGGKALFILPSHLAFGLLGDGERVPSRAILVYEIGVVRHNGKEFQTNFDYE